MIEDWMEWTDWNEHSDRGREEEDQKGGGAWSAAVGDGGTQEEQARCEAGGRSEQDERAGRGGECREREREEWSAEGGGHNFWPSDGWASGCNLRERER